MEMPKTESGRNKYLVTDKQPERRCHMKLPLGDPHTYLKLFMVWDGRLLRLGRLVYHQGIPGGAAGVTYKNNRPGYSASISLALTPVLFRWRPGDFDWILIIFGVRIHHQKSFGGWIV